MTDKPHMDSWSPEDQPCGDGDARPSGSGPDLRILAKVWKAFAEEGGMASVPERVMRKYTTALIDKHGVLEESCPVFITRERRSFMEFLQRQDHHDEKLALDKLKIGMSEDESGTAEVDLPDWVRNPENWKMVKRTETEEPSNDSDE